MPKNKPQVYTEIQIKASKEKVWQVLTDFQNYPSWNTFIRKLDGSPNMGAKIEAKMFPPVGLPMTFDGVICRNIPNQTLAWNGYMVARWLFAPTHIFEIEEKSENEVLFIHREEYEGAIIPLIKFMLPTLVGKGFELMNQDLKKIVEK
ncbi:SRPBCC domain-containing protein [Bernardetia sp.]|uniref:SRPBCC domain-containing protein n=1 Tax=Bernardetia sp. TaxID=1937974 RepID=UPI0025C538E0|nr:SRPBCC domain-containing protein [Bernardetia sp.]